MSFDTRAFRDALGSFATGVTVVTTMSAEGEPIGLTANSFSSVSLDPPLVLFCLGRQAFSFAHFQDCSHFAVNVLSAAQQDISNHFAKPSVDKWNDVDYDVWGVGVPVFKDSLAVFECALDAIHDAGDHIIVVGKVEHFTHQAGAPLLYFQGSYGAIKE